MKKTSYLAAVLCAALIAGSMRIPVFAEQTQEADAQEVAEAMSLIGKYDSADTATIVAVDTNQQLIRLFNHERGRTYTLSYDNTSMIFDASLNALSARLLEAGTIVDLTFLKSTHHLNSMVISRDAFSYEDVADYDLNAGVNTARVYGKFYRLTPMTLILADGEQISMSSILSADTINVRGVGDEIYAVTIAKGHGYLSLSADSVGGISLIDGWLELGSSYIRRITPGMFATVPEGTYELRIEGEGFDFTDEVTIYRNRETVVDVSQISSSNARMGTVIFHTSPEDAAVYVDNERAINDIEMHYSLGIHPLRVEADGHTTLNAYLKVGRQQATINLNLQQTSASASASATGAADTSGAYDTSSAYGTTTDASSAYSSIYGGETWSSNTGASYTGVYTTPAPAATTTAASTATTAASTATTNASTGNTTNASTDNTTNASSGGATTSSYSTGGNWSNAGNGAGNQATNESNNGSTGATNTGTEGATNGGAGRGNTSFSGWIETNPSEGDANGGWIETDPDTGKDDTGVWVNTDPDESAVSGRRVSVENPRGAQLYLDGVYVGTTPTYFEKVPGLHTVTLRMDGYMPQTYTISVDSSDENRTYNFPALIAQ